MKIRKKQSHGNSERPDNSLLKDHLSRILKDVELLPALTKRGWDMANRCPSCAWEDLVSGDLWGLKATVAPA